MERKYDLQAIAKILCNRTDTIAMTQAQYYYLKLRLRTVNRKDERDALENKDFESEAGKRIINRFREDEKLMAILGLGDFSVTELIDALVEYIEEDDNFELYWDPERGYSFPIGNDKVIIDKSKRTTPTIDEFLSSEVCVGPLCEQDGTIIDRGGHELNLIYKTILREKNASFDKAKSIDLTSLQVDIIRHTDAGWGQLTNRILLNYFVVNENKPKKRPFTRRTFRLIKEYFEYWLGNIFRLYSHSYSNSDE